MSKTCNKFPMGDSGWGVSVTSGIGVVEVAITGPESGWYPGDWGTPEQAEAIALGIVRAAQVAREKMEKTNQEYIVTAARPRR